MTATAAYTATMTELRDPAPSSIWSTGTYMTPLAMPPRLGSSMEPGLSSTPSASHSGRPRSEQASVDHQSYSYTRYSHDDPESYGAHAGYSNSLKRSFAQTEQTPLPPPPGPQTQPNPEIAHEDGTRINVGHDHKLLAFRRNPDKHTITDQHGRLQQLEMTAQLHGMFFLSEMPSTSGDGTTMQPELTCYRRNLFQISGSLVTPRTPLSVMTDSGESVGVSTMEVTISAIESVDGNPVRLIVIPWKTPPPNSPEVNIQPDQEPQPVPLIPYQDQNSDLHGDYTVYPVGWRRLQFRIATANNGRRKELQQHFVLHLKAMATLNNNSKICLAESTTAPIVVRGRSPRNFSTRKEIPLLGSSTGSRGQVLVESGVGVITGPPVNPPKTDTKQSHPTMDMQLTRSEFTFSPPKVPSSSHLASLRSSTYPAWQSTAPTNLPPVPSSTSGAYTTSTSLATDTFPKLPLSGGPTFSTEAPGMPLQSSMAPSVPLSMISEGHSLPHMRSYSYVPAGAPRYTPSSTPHPNGHDDIPRNYDEGRPAKSARQSGQSSIHGGSAESTSDYRYGSYPPTSSTSTADIPPSSTWTTTSGAEHGSTTTYANSDGRPYQPPYESYKNSPDDVPLKQEPGAEHTGSYAANARGSFDSGMNHYSWSSS